MFDRVAIIGTGLIGASLALALKRHGLANHVVGCARTQETIDKALALGILDSGTTDIAAAVNNADFIMLAAPVGAFRDLAKAMAPHLKPGAIVSDAGSVKQAVIDTVAPELPAGVHFIPAHPIAGTEHSGPEAGFAELFEGRWCILTPPPESDPTAIEKVTQMWRGIGMQTEIMDAEHHDKVLAITSHLPHLIAYTIVGTATDLEAHTKSEVFKFAAGGFRDFTRIAASDPVMWRDVFLNNREAVLDMLGRFTEDLSALQKAIRNGDGKTLEDHFARTREIRRGVIDAKQA
ncbi:MAG: prephenate/arogenate dehydrogenase family protein [Rhodospirillaceae bacterium]|jgi:cyclohexadieny/prephenate dehydrogenase|nr:prephenate/arogenate dehydrogenase family protein [Rhodospirillaceae bacterium]MBT5374829.1 prephenate/arogenate dehydrogenase family protein [Rhodospirillaceae bacterium]MBT5752772.1 prephenate/arogenate dehydrogenase family protein [Rhodospirillaceae bacterium]